MGIFRTFVETLSPLVPSVLRKRAPVPIDDMGTTTSSNLFNLALVIGYQFQDALAQALQEQAEVSWPIPTASAWVLDQHWGPYHDMLRNGMTDAQYRLFIQAKRLLIRSWGAADQALEIFRLLLPTSTLTFTPSYPKTWTINITGVDIATAAPAVLFMTKFPSPRGGGFSVAGDNGFATVADAEVFSFNSVHADQPKSSGWYSSVHGAVAGSAGWAHVATI